MSNEQTPLAAVIAEAIEELFALGRSCGISECNHDRTGEAVCIRLRDEIHASLSAAAEQVERLQVELAAEKQKNMDHAEDWAMCGLAYSPLHARALVLADENRELKARLNKPTEPPPNEVVIAAKRFRRPYSATQIACGLADADAGLLANYAASLVAGGSLDTST